MNSGKQKVLVVDDDEFVYLAVSTIFEKIGYQVISATHGKEALRLADAEVPRCIFLDIQMPGMNGHEVCAGIRSNPKTQSIPVIFVSAKDVSKGFDEEIAAGGDFFVSKPFMPNDLAVDLYFLNEIEFKPKRPDLAKLRVTKALPKTESSQAPTSSTPQAAPPIDTTAKEAAATSLEDIRSRAREEYKKESGDLGEIKDLRFLMLSTSYRLSALIRILEEKGILREGDVDRTLRSIMQQERPLGRSDSTRDRNAQSNASGDPPDSV